MSPIKGVLLVEPDFPYPSKSKNKANHVHKNFVPIGLLKFGSFYKDKGVKVKLVRGKKTKEDIDFTPDKILITSLFTYWSNYVWDCIQHYRNLFPDSEIDLGGIYATLHKDTDKFKALADRYKVNVSPGIHPEAEKHLPDYELLPSKVDYHATHMMRGCIRRCNFCGTWRLEPDRTNKKKEQVIDELVKIGKNRVIFYDNNLLSNPHIKEILGGFNELRINSKPVIFESQSGFDGRILEQDPELAGLLKQARFRNVRIAWDNGIEDEKSIKKQVDILTKAGYTPKDISVFMIYNFDRTYEDMLVKLNRCKTWGVQITDCRYRPLESDFDNYSPSKRNGQTDEEYYIHKKGEWSDRKIRDFRKKVREHNIEIRYGGKYDKDLERWSTIHNTFKFFNLGRPPQMDEIKKSQLFQKRIKLLNRLKGYFQRSKTAQPDFSELSKTDLDKTLDELVEKYLPKRQKQFNSRTDGNPPYVSF
jgi:hypothetical protein